MIIQCLNCKKYFLKEFIVKECVCESCDLALSMLKRCANCEAVKPFESFRFNHHRNSYRFICFDCEKEYARESKRRERIRKKERIKQ